MVIKISRPGAVFSAGQYCQCRYLTDIITAITTSIIGYLLLIVTVSAIRCSDHAVFCEFTPIGP
jgi:hypothetical protein